MDSSLPNIEVFNAPPWCLNGHVHTIAQSLLSHPIKPPCERIQISTPDDDFLELDVIDAQNDRPAIALFHGLEGSSSRYYIVELMNNFAQLNYSVVGVNFRSCGETMNRKRRFYHSGETADFKTVFQWMRNKFPDSPIGAVGFSLGANALLKSLGEEGSSHPADAAVAVSAPYNLRTGSLNISEGFNKLYEYRFLRSLKKKLEAKQNHFADLPHFTGRTLYDFDNQITAPIHGFKNADDYYARCSSSQFVAGIQSPTLLIHSREDPICPVQDMPLDDIKANRQLDYVIPKKGGHVGFRSSPQGWLNKLITNYFQQKID